MKSLKMSSAGKNVVGNELYTVNASKIRCSTILAYQKYVSIRFPQFSPQRCFLCPILIKNPFQDCVAFTPSLAKPGFGRGNLLILKIPQLRFARTIQMKNNAKNEDVD